MSDTLVEARGLARTYRLGGGDVHALRGVDLAVGAGQTHLITGRSGSGKSTLLYLLGALERPTAGTVLFEGRDLSALSESELALLRRTRIGFVFQAMNLLPTLTALENVLLPAYPARRAAEFEPRATELLCAVGLEQRLHHPPARLSGGEQQRVAIARALLFEPVLLLGDEPTGELDSATGAQVIALLREQAASRGAALVIVTHDPTIRRPADQHHVIRDGRLVESTPGRG